MVYNVRWVIASVFVAEKATSPTGREPSASSPYSSSFGMRPRSMRWVVLNNSKYHFYVMILIFYCSYLLLQLFVNLQFKMIVIKLTVIIFLCLCSFLHHFFYVDVSLHKSQYQNSCYRCRLKCFVLNNSVQEMTGRTQHVSRKSGITINYLCSLLPAYLCTNNLSERSSWLNIRIVFTQHAF